MTIVSLIVPQPGVDAALLVVADVLFLLEQPFKFGRKNCIIVRQSDVVVLDAWRQLVSDVDIADSTDF